MTITLTEEKFHEISSKVNWELVKDDDLDLKTKIMVTKCNAIYAAALQKELFKESEEK